MIDFEPKSIYVHKDIKFWEGWKKWNHIVMIKRGCFGRYRTESKAKWWFVLQLTRETANEQAPGVWDRFIPA